MGNPGVLVRVLGVHAHEVSLDADSCTSTHLAFSSSSAIPPPNPPAHFARTHFFLSFNFISTVSNPDANLTYSQGVAICIGGLGMLVASDEITDKSWEALARGKGDGFMVAGATLYGISELPFLSFVPTTSTNLSSSTANASEEFFVRKRPLYEVVGQLGMWGFLICGAQAAGLEHEDMKTASWNGATSAFHISLYFAGVSILTTYSRIVDRVHSCDAHPVHRRTPPLSHGLLSVLQS